MLQNCCVTDKRKEFHVESVYLDSFVVCMLFFFFSLMVQRTTTLWCMGETNGLLWILCPIDCRSHSTRVPLLLLARTEIIWATQHDMTSFLVRMIVSVSPEPKVLMVSVFPSSFRQYRLVWESGSISVTLSTCSQKMVVSFVAHLLLLKKSAQFLITAMLYMCWAHYAIPVSDCLFSLSS